MQTTPPGIHHLQWGLYLIYAVLNAAFVPLVYYVVVETQGKSLEDIDRWFDQNRGWLVHKVNHSVDGQSTSMNGRGFGKLQIADDHEAMMRAFEVSADDDDDVSFGSESPVTRRGSYPMVE